MNNGKVNEELLPLTAKWIVTGSTIYHMSSLKMSHIQMNSLKFYN